MERHSSAPPLALPVIVIAVQNPQGSQKKKKNGFLWVWVNRGLRFAAFGECLARPWTFPPSVASFLGALARACIALQYALQ